MHKFKSLSEASHQHTTTALPPSLQMQCQFIVAYILTMRFEGFFLCFGSLAMLLLVKARYDFLLSLALLLLSETWTNNANLARQGSASPSVAKNCQAASHRKVQQQHRFAIVSSPSFEAVAVIVAQKQSGNTD